MSASNEYDLFGADILVGNNFQAALAANGELVLTTGCACAVQMVAIRIFTMLGTLFYDTTFGCLFLHWIREESTPITRAGLCAEVEIRVNADPHVIPGTAVCKVAAWDHQGVDLDLRFTLIEQTHPEHLVLRFGQNETGLTMEIVKNANPREDSLL